MVSFRYICKKNLHNVSNLFLAIIIELYEMKAEAHFKHTIRVRSGTRSRDILLTAITTQINHEIEMMRWSFLLQNWPKEIRTK